MKKLKLFLENFIVYGFGGIICKLIPLIMLPIITKIMPGTFYYGLSDLSNTLIQFSSALAVMGLYDAMYRMFFEKEDLEYKKMICSTAFVFTCVMSLVIFVLLCVFSRQFSALFFSDKKYYNLVYLAAIATLIGATNTIISAPTRMQNKRKIYLITNTISPLIAYGLAIVLLMKGHYLYALPVAAIVSALTLEIIFLLLNHSWFKFRYFDIQELRKLLILGVPLLLNLLIYWLFNSCDKIMISNLLGVDASGIYSVASKLGHVSQLVYTAFAGGWQYFAFSTMKDENQVESNSKIFEYMGAISFFLTSIICASSFVIFKSLFKDEYLSGYISAPYLFLAPLLQMLFQIICNQFLVIRKTWPEMFILGGGACINVVLNYLLIPYKGIEGASIATLSGYIVSLIVCMIVLVKMNLLIISKKMIINSFAFVVFFLVWRNTFPAESIVSWLFVIIYGGVELALYRNDIRLLLNLLIKTRKE